MRTYPSTLGRGGAYLKSMATYLDEIWNAIVTNPYGTHFFVDPITGSDSQNGLTPAKPKATIAAALALCVDERGDFIWSRKGTHTVTETIAFNKKGVTLIGSPTGFNPFSQGERFCIAANASFITGPVATITRPTTIIGMGFWGRQTAGPSVLATYSAGGFSSGGWGMLYRCWFPNHGEIQRGLDLIGIDRFYVVESIFEGSNNGALSAGGKRLTVGVQLGSEAGGAAHNSHVIGCEFINVLTAVKADLATPKSDPVHGNVGCTLQANKMLAIPGTHFFLDVEDTANVRPQKIHVMDNYLGVALASEAYKLGGAAQANLTALVTAGLQFSNNHYAE